MTRPDQPRDLLLQLAFTNALGSALFDQELEKRGVAPTQAGLLMLLGELGRATPTELERESGLAGGTIRDRMARLVDEGLVRRTKNEQDQRSVFLEVTAAGSKVVSECAAAGATIEKLLVTEGIRVEDVRNALNDLAAATKRLLKRPTTEGIDGQTTGPW